MRSIDSIEKKRRRLTALQRRNQKIQPWTNWTVIASDNRDRSIQPWPTKRLPWCFSQHRYPIVIGRLILLDVQPTLVCCIMTAYCCLFRYRKSDDRQTLKSAPPWGFAYHRTIIWSRSSNESVVSDYGCSSKMPREAPSRPQGKAMSVSRTTFGPTFSMRSSSRKAAIVLRNPVLWGWL